ncbi:MAG TPA: glycosyltransferase family 4 protein [Thermoleophilaceae bacterium]|nr:glycosyltransferase family 4 protein [Thermoleophilaceae bacterium]
MPSFAARLHEVARAWRPQIVQAELHVMGQYLSGLGDPAPHRVLVEHEPGSAAARDLIAWEHGLRRAGRRLDALAWRRYEPRVLAAADAVVAFTGEDAAALAPLGPRARMLTIPLGIPIPERASDPIGKSPPAVLFIGSFGHPPNVDAAVRLARDIFPGVRARLPDARLEIVGAAPPPEVRRLAGPGVVVTGRVADVSPHLGGAAVVAAPMRLGGGMRVKVLEALAAGKALVATPRAVAGLGLEPGRHALVAEGDDGLGDALVSLLSDPDLRGRLGAAARAHVAEHLSWERATLAYEDLYGSLLASRAHTAA